MCALPLDPSDAEHNGVDEFKAEVRHRERAIFWTVLALGIGLFFYIALGRERGEVRWFFAWYFAKPALWMTLVALVTHNLWRNTGGTPRESSVVPWLITILAFPFVAYFYILPVGLAGISAVK